MSKTLPSKTSIQPSWTTLVWIALNVPQITQAWVISGFTQSEINLQSFNCSCRNASRRTPSLLGVAWAPGPTPAMGCCYSSENEDSDQVRPPRAGLGNEGWDPGAWGPEKSAEEGHLDCRTYWVRRPGGDRLQRRRRAGLLFLLKPEFFLHTPHVKMCRQPLVPLAPSPSPTFRRLQLKGSSASVSGKHSLPSFLCLLCACVSGLCESIVEVGKLRLLNCPDMNQESVYTLNPWGWRRKVTAGLESGKASGRWCHLSWSVKDLTDTVRALRRWEFGRQQNGFSFG